MAVLLRDQQKVAKKRSATSAYPRKLQQ